MTGGTTTSTKQFVWSGNERCEARDATSALVNQYFARGQVNVSGGTGTSYFYSKDHLGSVRRMADSAGVSVGELTYDPYGRAQQTQGSAPPDFQYAGYYAHTRSGLCLTRTRAYASALARFIRRDPAEEAGGLNLYAYAGGNPINASDPSGLKKCGTPNEQGDRIPVSLVGGGDNRDQQPPPPPPVRREIIEPPIIEPPVFNIIPPFVRKKDDELCQECHDDWANKQKYCGQRYQEDVEIYGEEVAAANYARCRENARQAFLRCYNAHCK